MPGRRPHPPGTPHTTPVLSDVELKVLEGRANGLTYMQLAGRLRYSHVGIKKIGLRVLVKLDARDMAHAVLIACHAGLLDGRPRRHGDHAGFAAHIRRGEDPWACEACAEGERTYRRGRKAARRTAKHDTQHTRSTA